MVARGVAATWRVARQVALRLPAGGVVALQGNLGAGKTTFVQGLARALGVTRPVTSPTFAIVSEYQGTQLRLIHFDLYRLHSPDDLLALGFQEYLERGALVALEWPDRAGDLLPPETIHVHLAPAADANSRCIEVLYPKSSPENTDDRNQTTRF
jgi:tRNA threonylcarbamoyladenosine biosynthesis protein TsaE